MGTRTENVELTVLCLIQDGNRILLQNRVKEDWKGYTLPGGHVETGESNEFQYTIEDGEWIVHLK